MTWKHRQSLGKCCYPRCERERLADADYCKRHDDDKRERNKLYMRRVRMWRRLQLGLGL